MKNINDRSSIIQSIEDNLFDHIISICMLNRKAKYTRKSRWMELYTGIQHPLCNGIIDPRLDKDHIDEDIKEATHPFQKLIPMLWPVGAASRSTVITNQPRICKSRKCPRYGHRAHSHKWNSDTKRTSNS